MASAHIELTGNETRLAGQFRNGGATQLNVATGVTSGNMAIAGATAYIDGSSCGTITTGTVANFVALYIGATNNNGSAQMYLSGKIQAVAIWDTSIDHATWMPAVSAAAAAL